MSSIKREINELKKENKDLLKSIDKATASLNKGNNLSSSQQQAQFDTMQNSMQELQANLDRIRNLESLRSQSQMKNGKWDLSRLTIPQIENFKGHTVKRPAKVQKTTAAQRRKTGNRVRL